ncbi:type VI immunity family protein [Paraburkholderia unamae]|uniref:type VI immunity family protein n=1 Tax=Paraburkholderia unamae TaxID=219649 RepID=UPI0035A2255D
MWDQGTFPIHDFVLACCNRLNATHGYAGFSLALPDEFARWQPYELELAERYFGLEIDVPVFVALMTEGWKGIKGVNWYTVLGSRYTEELGGAQSIHSQLTDPAFRIYHLNSGGVVIRAGDGPQMAPVAKGLPPLYVAVNKIVRPARTTKVQSIGLASIGGELRFNDRLTDLWMRRFDAPGIWPPAHP